MVRRCPYPPPIARPAHRCRIADVSRDPVSYRHGNRPPGERPKADSGRGTSTGARGVRRGRETQGGAARRPGICLVGRLVVEPQAGWADADPLPCRHDCRRSRDDDRHRSRRRLPRGRQRLPASPPPLQRRRSHRRAPELGCRRERTRAAVIT